MSPRSDISLVKTCSASGIESFPCHAADDPLLDFIFTDLTGVIGLQLSIDTLKEPFEKVLCGCIHHLGFDTTAIRVPAGGQYN